MSEQRVSVEIADHVADVCLTRPDKHNALDGAMFAAILDAAAEVSAAEGVRAVVLHGEGKSFCAGLDLTSMGAGEGSIEDQLAREPGQRSNGPQRAATDWIDVPAPVICAIQGNCLGGGLQIALGADIRFATADAKLSIRETHWGLIPDMGITSTLPRLVPIDVAKELTWTAKTISGEEAAELGLVTHLAEDPLAAARELAAEIAQRSPDAVRAGKQLFDTAWNAPVEEGLELETNLQLELIGSENQLAAITAGITKEPAKFKDPEPRVPARTP